MTLVASYQFDELEGSVLYDRSGNGHHGTIVGGEPWDVIRGVPGVGKTAMLFGNEYDGTVGTMTYVRIPSHPDFSIGTDGMTIEAVIAPSTMSFQGTTAPLCPGYPAANYITFANKHGVNADAEWLLRMYPHEAVGGGTCKSRAGRVSGYAFSPSSGLGSGSYNEALRVPGVYMTVRAAYDPPGVPNARVHLWVNGVKSPPSSGDLYSTYNVNPTPGPADVILGAGFTDSVPVQFRGAFDSFKVWRGVVAP